MTSMTRNLRLHHLPYSLVPIITLFLGLFASTTYSTTVSSAVFNASVDLIDAGHILHFLGIVDAFGHVSVRNPDNASQFIMSFSIAPALATSQHLVTYDIANATSIQLTFNPSVAGNAVPAGFAERFIHSELYKAFPNVMSVVHSHTSEVLPFAAAGIPLKAQLHTAGSLGTTGTPIFDAGALPPNILPANQLHDLLIRNSALGKALAGAFKGNAQVVLMTHHGLAIRSPSTRDAVFRAFYLKQDAVVTLSSVQLFGVLGQGAGAGGNSGLNRLGLANDVGIGLRSGGDFGLTSREAMDAEGTTESESLIDRAWGLWVRQVDTMGEGLYVNDLRMTTGASV